MRETAGGVRVYLLTDQSMGAPVFSPQGKALGITLQHFANGRSTAIVLPAADIAEMAKQAAAAQAAPAPATPAASPPPEAK